MFDKEKMQALPEEWGFFHEKDREIHRVGYATNLTEEIIKKAKESEVGFLLTHHDSWEFIFGRRKDVIICWKSLI